jgi:very-short-patch-repair endonuclease
MRNDIDERMWALAQRQDNVFSRRQAYEAGADAPLCWRRARAHRWVPVGNAAFRPAGAVLLWRGRLRAALWDAGDRALISHDAAAQLFSFPGYDQNAVKVLVPRALDHVCTIADIHETRRFDLVRARAMWGIPAVAPADTIVHVAPRLGVQRLSWLTDELLLSKKFDLRTLNNAFGRLAPGVQKLDGLRAVLNDHAPGDPIPESQLERQFVAFASTHRLPPFVRQANIPGRHNRPARVDFVWPEVKLIVELDGRRWHARLADFDRDHLRDLHALGLGYRTARITWAMLTVDHATVAEDLLAARSAAA